MAGRIDYEAIEQNIKIDVKDRRILTLLAKDSRMPLTQIAKKVRLSRDAVDYRIKRLQKEGILLQFFPNLDYEKLGFYIFHVFLLLDELDQPRQQELITHLKKHPNVCSVIEYSDRWDLEIVLLAKNLLDFDTAILDISGQFPNVILEKDKTEIIRRYNVGFLPPLLKDTDHGRVVSRHEQVPTVEVDEKDLQILNVLSKNCRVSTYEIGKTVKMSADAVGYRIKKLKEEGIIRHFTILVNYSKLKYYWYTYTVEVKMFDRKNEMRFEEFLDQNRNILRSAKTLGGWDLLLYIVVQNPREFHTIVKRMKNLFATVIRNYQTWIAYKEHIYTPMPKCIMEK